MDMKAKELLKHSARTAIIASSFSRHYLKMPEDEINNLFASALLHDIGKLFIPNNILYKESKLTEKEFEEIKKHPVYSYNLLSVSNKFDEKVLRAVKEHHERIDGRGYPLGLMGDEISFLSKILSICDAYEAMTTDRCYQKAKSNEEAIAEIKKGLGTQFDKELGLCFIDFAREEMPKDYMIKSTAFYHDVFPLVMYGSINVV